MAVGQALHIVRGSSPIGHFEVAPDERRKMKNQNGTQSVLATGWQCFAFAKHLAKSVFTIHWSRRSAASGWTPQKVKPN